MSRCKPGVLCQWWNETSEASEIVNSTWALHPNSLATLLRDFQPLDLQWSCLKSSQPSSHHIAGFCCEGFVFFAHVWTRGFLETFSLKAERFRYQILVCDCQNPVLWWIVRLAVQQLNLNKQLVVNCKHVQNLDHQALRLGCQLRRPGSPISFPDKSKKCKDLKNKVRF